MKVILFCQNAYAFGILNPIKKVLNSEGDDVLWFISSKLLAVFPFKEDPHTTSILDLQFFKADAIFVPGNEVPYYLRGLKVQIFHGLAGEKKGHFRIRHYFDLYLTQGPYFTKKFEEFRDTHQDFDVIETGWSKLDIYRDPELNSLYLAEREDLLNEFRADKIILYAPTFSPSLTSVPYLLNELKALAKVPGYLILIKFHDLMDKEWVERYRREFEPIANVRIRDDKNIIKLMIQADLLVSDTSSVIYEFILLDKPVISFNSVSKHIHWEDSKKYTKLVEMVSKNLSQDIFANDRAKIKAEFHPYEDGLSSRRMVESVKKYITENGVPEKRAIPVIRKVKIEHIFGSRVLDVFQGKKISKISALLITYNEILHIEEVLENLKFADEIIVVDSFSTDGTAEKIKDFPHVKCIQRPFKNFTDQKTFAMQQASHDWILFNDADERITDKLKNEIFKVVNDPKSDVVAYFFKRSFMFKNKPLRFSGWQSDKNYRLFRKSKTRFTEDRIVHETLIVDGKVATLQNKLIHYSYRDYEDYKGKMVKYGKMKAQEELHKNYTPKWFHFVFRPLYKFVNHYFIRLGFLDGKRGIIICYLNALGVYARYKELKKLTLQNKI